MAMVPHGAAGPPALAYRGSGDVDRVRRTKYTEQRTENMNRLKTSPDGHFFMDEAGEPFFYLADTVWLLFNKLREEEVRLLFENRVRKGFTVIQAVVFALPIRLGLLNLLPPNQATRLGSVFVAVIMVNVGLAVFNMIPVPPLDGSKVLAGVAPAPVAEALERAEPSAPLLLMLLLFVLPYLGFNIVGILTRPVQRFLLRILLG